MRFAATLLKRRIARPGARAQSGAAALEFAFVGPFFIFLMAVAFDLGLLLFTQSVMNNAVRDASRLIMTNQTGGSSSSFSTKLCDDMGGLIPCGSIQYYVQSASAFGSMSGSVTTNASGNLQGNGTFSAGSPGQDVVVQVAYNRPTIIPWALRYINGTEKVISGNSTLLVSTLSFQNEP